MGSMVAHVAFESACAAAAALLVRDAVATPPKIDVRREVQVRRCAQIRRGRRRRRPRRSGGSDDEFGGGGDSGGGGENGGGRGWDGWGGGEENRDHNPWWEDEHALVGFLQEVACWACLIVCLPILVIRIARLCSTEAEAAALAQCASVLNNMQSRGEAAAAAE